MTRTVGLFIGHENDPLTQIERVFFEGTTAITQGRGVCYNHVAFTAVSGQAITDAWGRRDKTVAVPSKANAAYFAGIAVRSYDANSAGQWIDIYVPGSTCKIYVNEALTIGDKVICIVGGADVGQFTKNAFAPFGIGCAIIQQTAASGDEYVQARIVDFGGQSGLLEDVSAIGVGAVTFTLEGVSVIAADTIASDAENTLADGTWVGQRKGFTLAGGMTTSNIVITVTSGLQIDGSADNAALNTITMTESGDTALLEWYGDYWVLKHNTALTLA